MLASLQRYRVDSGKFREKYNKKLAGIPIKKGSEPFCQTRTGSAPFIDAHWASMCPATKSTNARTLGDSTRPPT